MTLAIAIRGMLEATSALSTASDNLKAATDSLKNALSNYDNAHAAESLKETLAPLANEPGATLADPEIEQTAPANEEIDYQEVSQAAVALSKVGGREAILQLLSILNVATLKDLPASRYDEALAQIDEIRRNVKVAA